MVSVASSNTSSPLSNIDKWIQVDDSRSCYFYDASSQESYWTPPPDVIEQLIISFSNSQLDVNIDDRNSTQQIETVNKSANEEKIEYTQSDTWAVKVHPDSGQIYHKNLTSGESFWQNKFGIDHLSEILSGMVDQQDIEASENDQKTKLAGFDLAPDRNIFYCEQAEHARKRLSNWLDRKKISVGEDAGVRIKWAEYADLFRKSVPKALIPFNIIVSNDIIPNGNPDEKYEMSFKCSLGATVSDLIDDSLKKFKNRYGRELDIDGNCRFIFKVVGFCDYLLHGTFTLGLYDYIDLCMRKQKTASLELIRLTDADRIDLGPLLDRDFEDERSYERSKKAENGDDWDIDLERLPTNRDTAWDSMEYISLSDVKWPFRVLIRGVENCPTDIPCDSLYIEVGLFYGGELLSPNSSTHGMNSAIGEPLVSSQVLFSKEPRWPGEWIYSSKYEVAKLPQMTRIGFMLKGVQASGQRIAISGVSISLVDYKNRLIAGKMAFRMWPHQNLQSARDPTSGKGENMPRLLNLASGSLGENFEATAGILHVVFDSYPLPVLAQPKALNDYINQLVAPSSNSTNSQIENINSSQNLLTATEPIQKEKDVLSEIAKSDPLYPINEMEKHLIWRTRLYCSNYSTLLPKFLQCVSWSSNADAEEARRLLCQWAPFARGEEVNSLELLDIKYSDPIVREYAVRQIDQMSDHDLLDFLLQLVQVLKYEPFHDSPLSRMLIRRALKSPYKIGHAFYWLLRSEVHNPDISERYGLLLEAYLQRCGAHFVYLSRQLNANDMIQVIAERIKTLPKNKRLEFARSELEKLNPLLPPKFQICLSPKIECKGIIAKKCKVMDSKKLPLWVVFENADPNGSPYLAIFKAGDDLRQDLMTLQMLKVMEKIWLTNGLDLRMNPYGCCATGHDLGMIEVVTNSETTANIQVKYGGKIGALKQTPIHKFLTEHNKDNFELARENFIRSCAGYCVATYVLGIGDRHADNIMVTRPGQLFHIDFGHFLGNFKSKFGIKRERAAFVFTPEMAYVMGSKNSKEFKDFESFCCKAYNLLRQNGSLLIDLLILMVPAAMPELLKRDDINYLRDKLSLKSTTDEADDLFKQEIKDSLNTVSRQLDNLIHNLKHG